MRSSTNANGQEGENEYRCGSEPLPAEVYAALDLKDPPSIQPLKQKRPKSSYTLIKTFSERKYQNVNRPKVVTYKGKESNYLQPHSSNAECQTGAPPSFLGNYSSLHASLQASSQQEGRRFQMSTDSESPFLASDLRILSRKIRKPRKKMTKVRT